MSSALPGPPKHRASAASKSNKQPVGLAYEGRIKWNVVILVSQLFLAQIGIWGLFRNLLDKALGRTFGSLIDWAIVLLPTFNILEALWARANKPAVAPISQDNIASMTPVQKRIQSLGTAVPQSILTNNSLPRVFGHSQSDLTPSRRDLRFPDLPAGFGADSSFNSGLSPSPSVQARSRMKASASLKELSSRDLFASRSSSVEPPDNGAPSSGLQAASTRSRRRAEGANSREPSPFSISSLSLKNVPKPGRALDSSSLRGLVS